MQTITVDMTPGFRQPTIHYSQNDVGTAFAIDLRSRFGDTLPASPTVKIQATKPSGFGFSIEADSVVDSVATFTTVATMTDEAGRFQAELQIIKDAVVIYTANFYMEGEANPHPIGTTDGQQETVIPTLTLLVERVEAAAASVLDMTVNATTLAAGSQATYSYDEATNTATFGIPQGEAGAGAAGVTASAYSSSKTYAVGDYVIHNSNLYRCTTAITTAEAFTAAHWTQVVLGDDVSGLKSEISDIQNEIGVYMPPTGRGTLPATSGLHTLVDPVKIVSGHSYSLQYSIEQASDVMAYFYVLSDDGQTTIASGNLNAGVTSGTKNFTASISDENAYIAVNANARPLAYSVTLIDNNVSHDSRITTLENDVNELNVFTGISDEIPFTTRAYISTPSRGVVVDLTPVTLNGCVCASVPCNKGDLFTLYGTPRDNSATRAYMWVNGDTDRCFYRYDETEVLNGSVIVAPVNGTLVINFSTSAPYSAYKGIRNLHDHVITNIKDIESIINSPLETMPEYITNDMAYKPLGQLQNPYLCLSCDDGSAELETYTIPMLLDKNVPCTFGLWATYSEYGATPVFSPSVVLRTQSGIDAVLSAVENGCEVAQHGTVEWTDMTEAELNDFFDREQVAFTNMGITVKGAICPSHCVNNKVRAIAGGRFGSVRSGYNGFKSKEDQQNHIAGDVFTPYGLLTGARSNCYSYTSFNTIDKTLNELKALLDNAISNNMCMIVYWHDWDLTTAQKETLEAFIDYAKTTTVQFCTLSEIPTLV